MRVVIAEDSVLLREGLTRLLTEAGHEVAAVAGDAEGFLRAVAEHSPEAVVVDVRMPPTFTDEGLRAALVVRDRWPKVGVLVLSQWVEERYATELISGRPHGVGYLLKDRVADMAEFLDALARVADGGSALDPEVVAQLLARSRHPLGELTPREREVLALMAEGRSNAAIADDARGRRRRGREAHQQHLHQAGAGARRPRPSAGPRRAALPRYRMNGETP